MKVFVDYDRCEGHGLCTEQAPRLFGLDDDAELTFAHEGTEVPAEHVEAARAAIDACPVAALRAMS